MVTVRECVRALSEAGVTGHGVALDRWADRAVRVAMCEVLIRAEDRAGRGDSGA